MKMRCLAVFLTLLTNSYSGPPDFDGVMVSQGKIYFALREDPAVASKWIKLGDRVSDYVLTSYDREKETLSLDLKGKSVQLLLKTGSVRSGPRAAPTIELLKALPVAGDVSQNQILDLLTRLRDQRDDTARKLAGVEARALKEPEPKRTEMVKEWRRRLELEDANLEYATDNVIAHWRDESRSAK